MSFPDRTKDIEILNKLVEQSVIKNDFESANLNFAKLIEAMRQQNINLNFALTDVLENTKQLYADFRDRHNLHYPENFRQNDNIVNNKFDWTSLSDEKKVFKGIKIIFALNNAKTVASTERRLHELFSLLTELARLEAEKVEFSKKYNTESWFTFVCKAITKYERTISKYVNETNRATTQILGFPSNTITEWESFRQSKLKRK